jgi:hypothetical protein
MSHSTRNTSPPLKTRCIAIALGTRYAPGRNIFFFNMRKNFDEVKKKKYDDRDKSKIKDRKRE